MIYIYEVLRTYEGTVGFLSLNPPINLQGCLIKLLRKKIEKYYCNQAIYYVLKTKQKKIRHVDDI
jgi:hypothetical protein